MMPSDMIIRVGPARDSVMVLVTEPEVPGSLLKLVGFPEAPVIRVCAAWSRGSATVRHVRHSGMPTRRPAARPLAA
jgi:hypothetical protein